ncbi:MAG: hypothetical protein AAGM67_21300, partial [Bacteroidota bacterium]
VVLELGMIQLTGCYKKGIFEEKLSRLFFAVLIEKVAQATSIDKECFPTDFPFMEQHLPLFEFDEAETIAKDFVFLFCKRDQATNTGLNGGVQ